MRVSVITPTFRPWDRLLLQLDDLKAQTLQDIEWIVVDDLVGKRPFQLEADFPIKHVAPFHGVTEYDAGSHAVNTGLVYAQGELVHFMNDYVRLSPGVLLRHWQLFQEFGPKVFISGPRIPMDGQPPVAEKARRDRPTILLRPGLGEFDAWAGRFSAGVNDSVPRDILLALGGINEGWDGGHGSSDYELACRLLLYGCRYLAELEEPVYEYPRSATNGPKKHRPTLYDFFGIDFLGLIEDYKAQRKPLVLAENGWIAKARSQLCEFSVRAASVRTATISQSN